MSIDKAKEEARKRKTKPARKVTGARVKAVKAWGVLQKGNRINASDTYCTRIAARSWKNLEGGGDIIPVRIVPLPPKRKASK